MTLARRKYEQSSAQRCAHKMIQHIAYFQQPAFGKQGGKPCPEQYAITQYELQIQASNRALSEYMNAQYSVQYCCAGNGTLSFLECRIPYSARGTQVQTDMECCCIHQAPMTRGAQDWKIPLKTGAWKYAWNQQIISKRVTPDGIVSSALAMFRGFESQGTRNNFTCMDGLMLSPPG